MKIAILDDYFDTLRTLELDGHEVHVTRYAPRTSATCRGRSSSSQFSDIFDQINAYAAGAPINVVNPAVLDARGTGPV